MTLYPSITLMFSIVVRVGTVIGTIAPVGTPQQAPGYLTIIVDKFILPKLQSHENKFL